MAFEGWQAGLWTAGPGIVTEVNLDAQTVSVQPALQGTIRDSNGNPTTVDLPVLVDVPLTWPRAGGFALTFPVAVGDEVLVVFGSRCIDSWWQNGGVQSCADARMHDLSDAFAILAPTSQPKKLSNVSTVNVQLRGEAGTTYLEITPDGKARTVAGLAIDMVAPTINMDADNINMTATTKIKMTAPTVESVATLTNIVGPLTVSDVLAAQGGLNVTGTSNLDGSEYGTHFHGGVQTGSGDTGAPEN